MSNGGVSSRWAPYRRLHNRCLVCPCYRKLEVQSTLLMNSSLYGKPISLDNPGCYLMLSRIFDYSASVAVKSLTYLNRTRPTTSKIMASPVIKYSCWRWRASYFIIRDRGEILLRPRLLQFRYFDGLPSGLCVVELSSRKLRNPAATWPRK